MPMSFEELVTAERANKIAMKEKWVREEREARYAGRRNWLAELSTEYPVMTHAAEAAQMQRACLSRLCDKVGFEWPFVRRSQTETQRREKVSLRVSREEAARLAAVVRGLG